MKHAPSKLLPLVGLGLTVAGVLGMAVAATRLASVGETRPAARADAAWLESGSAPQPPLLPFVPTYHRDVKPILERSCNGCHTEGGIAPFKLTDAKNAIAHARAAQLAVQSKRMPPWMPGGDSPKFRDEWKLSDAEIAVIANWSWAGAPEGKASDAKPAPARLADAAPDKLVGMGLDFQPDRTLSDEYRCFVIDPGLQQERYLSGYGIAPGNASIVHHVILFQVTPDLAAEAKTLEAKADGRGGYTCFGGPGVGLDVSARFRGQTTTSNVGFIGSWVPGSSAVRYPEGTGVLLRPGAQIIMQVHYNTLAGSGSDRTATKLYFAPAGESRKNLRLVTMIGPVEIACPDGLTGGPGCERRFAYDRVRPYQEAGLTQILEQGLLLTYCKQSVNQYARNATGTVTTTCDFSASSDRTVVGAQGHMHLLGRSIKLETNPGTARARTVLDIPRWDFHWQSGYWLEQPFDINKGDTMRVTCTFDNTQAAQPFIAGRQIAPRYVVWGEGTADEMCLGALQTYLR